MCKFKCELLKILNFVKIVICKGREGGGVDLGGGGVGQWWGGLGSRKKSPDFRLPEVGISAYMQRKSNCRCKCKRKRREKRELGQAFNAVFEGNLLMYKFIKI